MAKRRVRFLYDLRDTVERLAEASVPLEACARAAEALAACTCDPDFVLVYTVDDERRHLELQARCGPELSLAPTLGDDVVVLDAPRTEFAAELARVATRGTIGAIATPPNEDEAVRDPFGGESCSLIVPARMPGRPEANAVVVIGLPGDHDPEDDDLRSFFELCGVLLAQRMAQLTAEDDASARTPSAEMKHEFLATVSHELRTPLQAILGWANLLRAGDVDEERLAKGLRVIERNARAQAKLIEDILDVSRIISGKVGLQLVPVDVTAAVQSAIDTVRPTAQTKDVDVLSTFGLGLGGVVADPARLQQVISNLLSNAVKFTPPGGRIVVSVARASRPATEAIEIRVTDTGEGIDPEFLPHVFERFRQGDVLPTRAQGGLGLGLAIVRHIVELHGGTVEAESAGRGCGATFVVRLPVHAVLPEPLSERGDRLTHRMLAGACGDEEIDPKSLAGTRVLVVDDEDDARELVMVVLRERGAEPRGAGSVFEALRLAEEFRPDVVVADIGMPSEDGCVLIRRLRLRESDRRIPPFAALALTGYARPEDRRRALAAGFQAHVAKPVSPDTLVSAILRVTR